MFRSSSRLVSILAALVVLLLAGPSLATQCGQWLVPKPTGDNVMNTRTSTMYATLGEAVAAAQAGDTLNVLSYTLDVGAIKIDKNLTLTGDQTHVLSPAIDTCPSGAARGWFQVSPGVEFSVNDLSFNGQGRKIWEAFRHQGTGSFSSVQFSNISYEAEGPSYEGTAIAVFGNGAKVDVSHSSFDNMGRAGILYYGQGAGGTVNWITYTGKGHGNHLDYGVDVEAGAVVTIKKSTINQCLGSADGSGSAAVSVSTFQGPGTSVTLEDNVLRNNTVGIAAGYGGGHSPDTSLVVAHQNTLSQNQSGLAAYTDKPVNATGNYWGCTRGPGHAGCSPVTGPYAYQVDTGFGVSTRWSFSGGLSQWAPEAGESELAIVTFDPAPQDGTQVAFSSNKATFSIEKVEVQGGKAATTFTAPTGDGVEFGLTVTLDGTPSGKSFTTDNTSRSFLHITDVTNKGNGKYSVGVTYIGSGDSADIYAGTALGLSATSHISGCHVGLENAQYLGTVDGTGYASDPAVLEFQVPGGWAGQTFYVQAVYETAYCGVSPIATSSP